MTKSTAFLLCLACLVFGFVSGQNSMEEPKPEKSGVSFETLLTDMTSDGRRLTAELKETLIRTQNPLIADAFFEQTRALRLLAQETPDRQSALNAFKNFRKITSKIQENSDTMLADTLIKMPASDRDVYLKHHLKNKNYLMDLLIIQPLMTHVKTPKKETGSPRDLVVRTTHVPAF